MVQTTLFIDGEAREAKGGHSYEIYNPANIEELVGQAASASVEDVDEAISAAQNAYRDWSSLTIDERAAYLRHIAGHLNEDADDVAQRTRLFTREHGKTLFETTIEINRLADRFGQVAGFADALKSEEDIKGAQFDTIVTRQSRGVVTLIVPWNWPLAILGLSLIHI